MVENPPVCGDECKVKLVEAQMVLWMLYPLKFIGQSCVCLKGRECFTCHTKQDFAKELSCLSPRYKVSMNELSMTLECLKKPGSELARESAP